MNIMKFESIKQFEDCAFKISHQCHCNGIFEINTENVCILIDGISLNFKELHLLVCTTCGKVEIPYYSSKIVKTAYSQALKNGQNIGEFWRKDFRERFDYCTDHNFIYDHYDYYNIPGLMYDDEHSVKGFLAPVFFDKKVFQQFLLDEDYRVHLGAETYGDFSFKNTWSVPFGININDKVVFWLGDLSDMDNDTLTRIKPYNLESDHKLMSSEFYAGQMCCIWAKPNREYSIYVLRNDFYDLMNKRFSAQLYHLQSEVNQQMEDYNKPLLLNAKTFPETVAVLHQVLIEGINLDELRKLYCSILAPTDKNYKSMKTIKLYEGLLSKVISNGQQVRDVIAPLYLLNDLRICYDHLLSKAEESKLKQNIIDTLGIASFDEVKTIYDELLNRLASFYEYMNIGYSNNII